MEKTENYELNKPSDDDFFDIKHFNENVEKLDSTLNALNDSVKKCFQSVSEGKKKLATALTENGAHELDEKSTFEHLASEVEFVYGSGVQDGKKASQKGTATADCVRAGYTFTNASGSDIKGTMINHTGSGTYKYFWPSREEDVYYIPKGYHDGNGRIVCKPIDMRNVPYHNLTLAFACSTPIDLTNKNRMMTMRVGATGQYLLVIYNASYVAGSIRDIDTNLWSHRESVENILQQTDFHRTKPVQSVVYMDIGNTGSGEFVFDVEYANVNTTGSEAVAMLFKLD